MLILQDKLNILIELIKEQMKVTQGGGKGQKNVTNLGTIPGNINIANIQEMLMNEAENMFELGIDLKYKFE